MQYWLLKSEPDVWSIDQQKKAGSKGVTWDGVRNYQAANNLKKMKKGDLCFFYHSNIGKEIVGVIEVIKTAFIDKTDKKARFVAVKVKFRERLKKAVSLEDIKKNKALNHLSLIKQSRLSVMSIYALLDHFFGTLKTNSFDSKLFVFLFLLNFFLFFFLLFLLSFLILFTFFLVVLLFFFLFFLAIIYPSVLNFTHLTYFFPVF